MTRKDEIVSRMLALASIMEAESIARQASEWNEILAQRWCRVSLRTTMRDLAGLAKCDVVEVESIGGVNLYRWLQWPMPLDH